jgi:hypothetical protein
VSGTSDVNVSIRERRPLTGSFPRPFCDMPVVLFGSGGELIGIHKEPRAGPAATSADFCLNLPDALSVRLAYRARQQAVSERKGAEHFQGVAILFCTPLLSPWVLYCCKRHLGVFEQVQNQA